MIRSILKLSVLAIFSVGPAFAKEYVDYTPEKGLWEINAVEVDPNHVDDYLTGLKQSQVPAFEILEKHGLIDAYKFVVRKGYNKGSPNVLIMTHISSASLLTPDKTRDQMIEKEIYAGFSEDAGKAAVAGYEKYRQFLDTGYWSEVSFNK